MILILSLNQNCYFYLIYNENIPILGIIPYRLNKSSNFDLSSILKSQNYFIIWTAAFDHEIGLWNSYNMQCDLLLKVNTLEFRGEFRPLTVEIPYLKQNNKLNENELHILKEKNEFFNSIFIFLMQFSLKSALIEDENIQKKFFSKISIFVERPIPQSMIQKVINLVQDWHQYFSQMKIKYQNFWKDVINMFYALFMNNPAIQNNSTDIEKLWTLLIKKYMITFNDENKMSENPYSDKKEEIEIIKKIYIMVEGIVHKITNSQKLNWFESTKNMIKLYFPEILVDSK